jgi:hypothetical protein
MTQFERALSELNIEILCANTSQAKGRVDRRACDLGTPKWHVARRKALTKPYSRSLTGLCNVGR